MKRLLLTALGLVCLFASTFLIIKATGILTVDDIKAFLSEAHTINPALVAAVVIGLLMADMFVAVPTLTVTILAGYFLGFPAGFVAATTGLLLAGTSGYLITYLFGPGLLQRIHKDEEKQAEMSAIFSRYGAVVLVICRALPILPEVSCCLAGATRMRFVKFILAFMLGTVPYAMIATYAGSKSSLNDPMPAIFTAIGLSTFFAIAWTVLIRRHRAQTQAPPS